MSGHSTPSPGTFDDTVQDLRRRLGLFSFQHVVQSKEETSRYESCPDLGLRAGGILEWLTATPGAGAVACAMHVTSWHISGRGILVIVDGSRQFHAPALPGWGIGPSRTLVVRPATRREACWAIEQCLRCPGVSAVCAWVDTRFPTNVERRWRLAAEIGGGIAMFFRPEAARREPVWADSRLLVTPLAGDEGEARRVRIDVLYRRGGLGGTARVWEIDHAEGVVRVVPDVADPAAAERSAGA